MNQADCKDSYAQLADHLYETYKPLTLVLATLALAKSFRTQNPWQSAGFKAVLLYLYITKPSNDRQPFEHFPITRYRMSIKGVFCRNS